MACARGAPPPHVGLLLTLLVAFVITAQSVCAAEQLRGGLRNVRRMMLQEGLMADGQQQAANPAAATAAAAAAVTAAQATSAPLGCNNPASPQCDGQCEVCQPDGSCAPLPGPCLAGLLAGMCAAGKCQPSGCNNPAGPQCSKCETCQADGSCAPRVGPCRTGPLDQWMGTCAAGVCVADGCNNPANPRCDSQCETCGPGGACIPKPGACGAGPQGLLAGMCAAGKCEPTGCNNPANPRCDSQCAVCEANGACTPRPGSCAVDGRAGTCAAGKCVVDPFSPPPPGPPPLSPHPSPPPQSPRPPPPHQEPSHIALYVPFSLGVTNTHGGTPRYVVLTWTVTPVWEDELAGFKVALFEETIQPGAFVAANGWEGTVVRTSAAGAVSRSLRRVEVGEPTYEVRYRLTIVLPAPTAGKRVRVELASVAHDGAVSDPAVAFTKEDGGDVVRRRS